MRIEILDAGEIGFGGLKSVVEKRFDLRALYAGVVFERGVNRVVALQVIPIA
jgi:hypothetical protein